MAILVLMVLVAIVTQIAIGTGTGARVARNDVVMSSMDLAINSGLLQVYDELAADGQAPEAESPTSGGAQGGAQGDEGPEGSAQATDSREDIWARIKRPTIGDVELRVMVQDEDSKVNVLGMLTPDAEEAGKCYERVVRVLDLCREDTTADIDSGEARQLADTIRDFLEGKLGDENLPRPELLSDDSDHEDRRLPFSLQELVVFEPFHKGLFRDFRDEDGVVVHSIASFLTVWSSQERFGEDDPDEGPSGPPPGPDPDPDPDPDRSPDRTPDPDPGGDQGDDPASGSPDAGGASGQASAGAEPGVGVNVNTASPVVLKALLDDGDVPPRFWDEVVEYRNLEEEEDDDEEEAEPVYDEWGEEVIRRRIYDSLDELSEVRGWDSLDTDVQSELRGLLTTQSQVFSIFITARRTTGEQNRWAGQLGSADREEREDELGNALVRTVQSVVWRLEGEDGFEVVPLTRWKVLDYVPFEILDYPDEYR